MIFYSRSKINRVFLLVILFVFGSANFNSAYAGKTADSVMQKLDRNGDTKLSKKEWRKKRIFDDVDLDGDGFISHDELMIRFGEKARNGAEDVELPDPVTLSAIRRGGVDDVQHLKDRGLFETGLEPTWPDDVECRGIDEWYAKDYTPKRPKESYHGGIDIPAPFGTPTHAIMNGEVVAIYDGKHSPRGIEVVIRHAPDDSGLPLYLYSRYTHFERMPNLKVGDRINMGDVIGAIGNSGVLGCELKGIDCRGRSRRPGLHFDILYTSSNKYYSDGRILYPFEAYWMDPNALYRKQMPVDSVSMRALPADQKKITISYMLEGGELVPSDTKMIWPYPCTKK